MKVFVSLSIHEGGPLPLLESMSCGCYPVVTNTGFASDIITSSKYGKIISPFEEKDTIISKIVESYSSKKISQVDMISRASKFSFKNLATLIVHKFQIKNVNS